MRHALAAAMLGAVAVSAVGLVMAQSSPTAQPTRQTMPGTHRHKLRPAHALPRPLPVAGTALGSPLAGLTATELAAFAAGLEEFESIETPESGLGPIFNDDSCAACHSSPVAGGVSGTTVTRFGRTVDGHFDPMTAQGGSLLQAKAIDPAVQEVVPADATIVAKRLTTPLFGAGLIEAIPDAELVALAALRKPDGVTGRVGMITDVVSGAPRVGRFGWKAQQATLLAFAGDAYLNEMGITNRFFPTENAPNGNAALLALYDRVPDLEDTVDPVTGRSDIDAAADFMRMLAPPTPLRTDAAAEAGRRVFARVNCDACHVPALVTGASPIAALSHKAAFLYSDLLLHDMGALADGIEHGAATGREMKTAPLWGLRARGPFLHDGRAATVDDAIRAHDGEARVARERYRALSDAETRALLAFLATI